MITLNETNDQCEPKVISAAVVSGSQVVEKGHAVGLDAVLALREVIDAYTEQSSAIKAKRGQK